MEFEGKVWKDGKFWVVEVSAIDLCTQGYTREEALFMALDAAKELLTEYFQPEEIAGLELEIIDYSNNNIGVRSSNADIMSSFSALRQRVN